MSNPRLHISSEVLNKDIVPLDKSQSNYLLNVLRLKKGDTVSVFDGEGDCCESVLVNDENGAPALKIIKRCNMKKEEIKKITIAAAILKGKKMSLVIQKLTEIGVDAIVPIVTERTIVSIKDGNSKKEKWKKTAIEAAKQCGRNRIPEISDIISFEEFINLSQDNDVKIIAYEQGGKNLKELIESERRSPVSVIVVIGPEGGFGDAEVEKAVSAGFEPVSLGANIMRAETAAIAAAVILTYEFSE